MPLKPACRKVRGVNWVRTSSPTVRDQFHGP